MGRLCGVAFLTSVMPGEATNALETKIDTILVNLEHRLNAVTTTVDSMATCAGGLGQPNGMGLSALQRPEGAPERRLGVVQSNKMPIAGGRALS